MPVFKKGKRGDQGFQATKLISPGKDGKGDRKLIMDGLRNNKIFNACE